MSIADDRMVKHRKSRMRKNFFSNLCNIGFGAAMNGGYLFGLVWGGYNILEGSITYGTLTAVLQLINQIQPLVADVTGYIPKYYGMIASAERLMELENMPEDKPKIKLTKDEMKTLYDNLQEIHLNHITFSYSKAEENILQDASYSFNKGDYVAILGESGIGKSTMLKLLLSLYDNYEGNIELILKNQNNIDDGVNADWIDREYNMKNAVIQLNASFRGLFSYVPQGNFLMSGTIADTIIFLRKETEPIRSEELKKVKEACKIACADTFIEELQGGYETSIGEKGSGLSEGQIQRIAIARAVYSDAPIILLDEATSALDEITEKRVLKNLKELTDKTVIIVTHRKAALDVCNKVVELADKKFNKKR